MIDKELLQEFIVEVREHIDLIESDLIRLEKDNSNMELINNIFGSFHSIKGSSGYIGLTSIYELTHALENVIDNIRKDKLQLSENIFDVIFRGLDKLKKIISDFEDKGDSEISTQQLVNDILAVKDGVIGEEKKKTEEINIEVTKDKDDTPLTEKPKIEPKKEVKEVPPLENKRENSTDSVSDAVLTDESNVNEFMEIARDILSSLENLYNELIAKKKFTKKDIRELANIFRNLILIAEYQGFDIIWKNLVSIERSMTGWKKKLPSTKKLTNWYENLQLIFSDSAVKAEESESKPKTEAKKSVSNDTAANKDEMEDYEVFDDYDKNLVQIFIDTIKGNLSLLENLLENINDNTARIQYIAELDKIIQAANYMDIEWIKNLIISMKGIILQAQNSNEDLNHDQIAELVNGGNRLKKLIDKWNSLNKTDEESSAKEEIAVDDKYDFLNVDKELIDIFVTNYNEYLEKVIKIIMALKDGNAEENSLELLKEFFSLMETSANYMNFQDLFMVNHDCIIMLENIIEPSELNSAKIINSLISYFNKIINLLNTIFKNEPYIWPHYIETIPEPETAQQEEKESTSEETEIDFSLDQLFGEGTETQEKKESEELSSESDHESEKLIEDKTIEEDSKKEENSAAAQVTISDETEQAIAKEIKQKTLRVNVSKIEDIMSLVGELVVNRSSFNQLTQEIRSFSKMTKLLPEMEINLERIIKDFLMKLDSSTTTLGRLINQIQEGVMRIRMLPVSNLFNRFPRMVREISKEAGKQVDLMLIGEETELDKTVIEEISDPLIHIIRNAIDHGIEDEETRKKRNKPPKGLLKISAFHDGGKINIVVSDDGRGINKTEVVKKAVEQGLIKKEQTKYLSDSEIYQFLFHPGFSTSEKVSSLSGRGVGLDVVKRNIENLNGSIIIFSKEDEGTEITIQIPLTLAIIQALLVGVGGETYCIPITSVIETLKVKPQEIETIEDNAVFYYRDKVISIIYLKELFEIDHSDNGQDERFIVVVNSGKDLIGIVVDKLIGQHDIVIKPLEEELISSEGISGAAILGSGKIALIIDIPSVGRMHYRIKKQKREYLEAAESFTDETN